MDFRVFTDSGLVQTWRLSGRARDTLTFTPAPVDFGERIIRDKAPPSQTVKIMSSERLLELRVPSVVGQEPRFSCKQPVARNAMGTEFEMLIQPVLGDRTPLGQFRVDIPLTPILPNGAEGPTHHLQVLGHISTIIAVDPPNIHFGIRELGTEATQEVALFHRDGHAIDVSSVITEDGSSVIESAGSRHAARRQFRIRQRFDQRGESVALVRFVVLDNQSAHPKCEVVMPVRYYGAAPGG